MRIRTNTASLTAQRFLGANTDAMSQNYERLSSGFRINKAADDAAGMAVSETTRAKIRGLNQAKRNAADATSLVQVAEGNMNEMSNILIRMRELTVQAASETLGNREKGYLNREYVALADEIDRISSTAEFNDIKLFKQEDKDQFIIQVGTNASAPEENIETISIDLTSLKFGTMDLGIGKEEEIGPVGEGVGPERENIAEKLKTLDEALTRISKERASLGAVQSRLSSSTNNLQIQTENLQRAQSVIKDVDFASETADLTQNRILTSSTTAVLAQANAMPEMALQLLR